MQTKPQIELSDWLLPGLMLIGFGLRLFQLDRDSLWFDDIITIYLAKLPLIAGLDGLLSQGIQLTPQYHWLTKVWLVVAGDQDWVVRFPAVCFSALTIPLIYRLGRLYFGQTAGLLAAALFTINPYQIWYAHEVKVYSLLTLAAIGSMYAFARLMRGQKATLQLAIFNMLGFSAHYFMYLLPTVQFVFLLLYFRQYYQHLRKWLAANIIASLVLAPWFGFIIQRGRLATGIGWVPEPNWLDPLLTLWNFSLGYREEITPGLILALIVVAITFLFGVGRIGRLKPFGQLVLLWFLLPLALVWSFSHGTLSFYVDRYFLVITPALTLLLAVGVAELPSRQGRIGLGVALLLATIYGLSQVYFNPTYFTRDNWRFLAQTLRQEAQPGDGLVTCADGYRLALDYYGLGDAFTDQRYYVYPANFNFDEVLASYQRLWIVTYNPRRPQHHLGYSYAPVLDSTLLTTADQTWLDQNPPQKFKVAGITMFLYTLNSRPNFNQLVTWSCSGEIN